MTDLLPCPFCGAVPVFVDQGARNGIHHELDDYAWDVACKTLGCYAEFGGENWETQEAVAEMWNRRATAEPMVIEAGSMTIGDENGLHMIIDGQGQRIYDGDRLVHNA